MLIVLPLFVAFGFVVGIEFRRRFRGLAVDPANSGQVTLFLFFCITIVAAFLSFAPGVIAELKPRGWFLLVSGWGFGVIAGYWFARHRDGRDRLILISAAAAMLSLSALEYDIKIFERLTKFTGGGVDIELSEGRRGFDTAPALKPQIFSQQGGPFPGATHVDTGVQLLAQLGEYLLRDEQYATLFAQTGPPPTQDGGFATLEKPRCYLAQLLCRNLAPAVVKLYNVQYVLRSESPSVAVFGDLSSEITNSFYDNHFGLNFGLSHLHRAIDRLEAIANAQSGEILPHQQTKVDASADQPDAPKPKLCKFFPKGEALDELDVGKEPALAFDPLDRPEGFVFAAYHGMTVALAQFALGNREGAIQFLDRLIQKQTVDLTDAEKDMALPTLACRKTPGEADASDCEQVSQSNMAKRKTAFLRLVTLVRLETIQDNLLDAWNNSAIDGVRLKTLLTLVDHYGQAFSLLRLEDRTPSIFRAREDGAAPPQCLDKAPPDPLERELAARWSTARMTLEANALGLVSDDPSLLRVHSELADRLDAFARYVDRFDIACAGELGVGDLVLSARSQLLREAGDYWAARGVTLADSDTAPAPAVAAWCRAKSDYETAKTLANALVGETGTPKEGPSDLTRLDAYASDYATKAMPVLIGAALDRVKAMLSRVPAAELDKLCPT